MQESMRPYSYNKKNNERKKISYSKMPINKCKRNNGIQTLPFGSQHIVITSVSGYKNQWVKVWWVTVCLYNCKVSPHKMLTKTRGKFVTRVQIESRYYTYTKLSRFSTRNGTHQHHMLPNVVHWRYNIASVVILPKMHNLNLIQTFALWDILWNNRPVLLKRNTEELFQIKGD